MRRIARPLGLSLALGLILATTACGKQEDEAAKPVQAAQAVSVAPAQAHDFARSILVSGPVSAWEDMQLGVELSGLRVTALHVDVGQHVRKGELLLEIDHRSLDSDLAQANAALREAEAGAALARSQLTRAEPLVRDKFISATQLDELRAGRTQAEARVATARAARDAAALRRSYAELRAPQAGIISKRLVQPGQVVAAGTQLLGLIRDGRLEWRADLAEAELAQVKPGDRIELKTRDGKAVEGKVRAVSPGVDASTRTGTVYADLPDPQGLQPGTYLQGRIDVGMANALTVPAAAVVLRDGFPTVFTVDEKSVAHQQRVQTGSQSDGRIEILQGIETGARVVTDGAGFLADGDAVRVIEAGTKATAP
ncbi:MAG: efflux RND transporter periplasmic adaptor subunit [Thermomonas sp.]|uniref:efflux RND transporter periplasmic adaptor subunit n=1 Tax=Thermomonas sp. TaxID=1971895 RepID=UPI0039E2EB4E